jgi:hypothetical protein
VARKVVVMIPAFSSAGVLPPFIGHAADPGPRSPYGVSVRDVVERFATSPMRCSILRGWLRHRAGLHSLGFVDGFQWLDGSFCEQLAAREPNDLDVVTFYVQPPMVDMRSVAVAHRSLFFSADTKRHHLCDAYFVALHDGKYAEPRTLSYWFSLFSHRRDDLTWKGILQVPLAPEDDADATNALMLATSSLPIPAAP